MVFKLPWTHFSILHLLIRLVFLSEISNIFISFGHFHIDFILLILFFRALCVWVCLWMCICVHVWLQVYTYHAAYVEIRGHQGLLLAFYHVWGRYSQLCCYAHQALQRQAVRGFTCLCLLSSHWDTGNMNRGYHIWFYVGSGPHICVARASHTEPSP